MLGFDHPDTAPHENLEQVPSMRIATCHHYRHLPLDPSLWPKPDPDPDPKPLALTQTMAPALVLASTPALALALALTLPSDP